MKKALRQSILLFYDIVAICCSYFIAFVLRFDTDLFVSESAIRYFQVLQDNILWILAIKIVVLMSFGMYNSLWKHAGMTEMLQIVKASAFSTGMSMSYLIIMQFSLPRSVYVLSLLFDILFIGGIRFSYRFIRMQRRRSARRTESLINVMIIGAGQAGTMMIKEMLEHPESNYNPVVIIDDDKLKHKSSLMGIPIVGGRYIIEESVEKFQIHEIVMAIPSLNKKDYKEFVNYASHTGAKLKTVPSVYEIINGKISISEIREVDIKDILGRKEVELEISEISQFINGKSVLVTGSGGSIGSELCRQIAKFEPEVLLMLDIYENNVYALELELSKAYAQLSTRVIIASVRDRERVFEIFEAYKPHVVFHAAAHKHVPLMENNPVEAIKNNVFGTQNVVDAAIKYYADRFTLISTDKAVNPTNVMGASKRICELIVQANCENEYTKLSAVRFGNVLGSNGSVIPIFKKQIEEGGPVTLTHKDIIRYFMTIPEAAKLVIQATTLALEGEIFVLDMGDPVKIIDLAENMIKLSGMEPYKDIDIKVVGLRPGEKLYEELILNKENSISTRYEKIFIERPDALERSAILNKIDMLREAVGQKDTCLMMQVVEELVPSYKNQIKIDMSEGA